jgi:hypothetical protein
MILSIIPRTFKSFFGSGTAFSEQIVPRGLGKLGVPAKPASRIGKAVGCALGLASVATAACFLAGIPIAAPMFLLAPSYFGIKGVIAATAVTGLLGGVGTVVGTTGLGMCRGGFGSALKLVVPEAPETSSFDAGKSAQEDFKKARNSCRTVQKPVNSPPMSPKP